MEKSCLNCRKMGVCKEVDYKIYTSNRSLEERKAGMYELANACDKYLVI